MTPLAEIGTLAQLVTRAAALWPDRTAWIFDEHDQHFTFAEVDRESSGIAAALAERGIGPGDRVAVMLRNVPAFPLTWLVVAGVAACRHPPQRRSVARRPRLGRHARGARSRHGRDLPVDPGDARAGHAVPQRAP